MNQLPDKNRLPCTIPPSTPPSLLPSAPSTHERGRRRRRRRRPVPLLRRDPSPSTPPPPPRPGLLPRPHDNRRSLAILAPPQLSPLLLLPIGTNCIRANQNPTGVEMDAEMELPAADGGGTSVIVEDIAAELISRLEGSTRDEDRHLCSVAGGTAHALREKGIAPTAVAYFAAAASALDRLVASHDASTAAADPMAPALLAFLAAVLPRVSPAVLRAKGGVVSEALLRVLGLGPALPPLTAKSALKCVSHMLVVGGKGSWSGVQPLYVAMLSFVTDPRPKVRKQSHACLCEVLRSFEGHDISSSASEQIVAMFERSLLLAGGSKLSNSVSEEEYKGALDVLHILNALKHSISLMPMRFVNRIFNNLKVLLDLRQPIVTRSVMEIMQFICCNPTPNADVGRLFDLLCSLALTVTGQEGSADNMASTARLLQVGTKLAYASKKEVCFAKLPIVFTALGDCLGCGQDEASHAATEALKDLVNSCLDETLVEEGVQNLNSATNAEVRVSRPSTIEKICEILEGFIGYKYSSVWDMSFQVLSAMFEKLGKYSAFLMAQTVKSLADMQNLPDGDMLCRKELQEALGSAVRAFGPDAFLNCLPLNLDAENLSDNNAWLLPILEKNIVGAPLQFFIDHILNIITQTQQKSQQFAEGGLIFSARSQEGLVHSLWALLPAFCNYPVDISSSFKVLKNILCEKLREEPALRSIICSSLQVLIQQSCNKISDDEVRDNELSISERKARAYYTHAVMEESLKALRSSSSKFCYILYEIFMESSGDSGGFLLATISQFASLPSEKNMKSDANRFFVSIMRKLSNVTLEAVNAKQTPVSTSMQIDGISSSASITRSRALLLDLAVSLLPGLGQEEISLLLLAIEPAFKDEEGMIQKKAYKALSNILKEPKTYVYLSSKLAELLDLMLFVLPLCHFSAKRHRLDALYSLIVCISKDSSGASYQTNRDTFINSFLTEIVLALKESNKKTRDRAYELLVQIGYVCRDEDKCGTVERLIHYFNTVAGGLAGNTPQMISAAVRGLACLSFKFPDLIGEAYKVLPSTLLLLQRDNREIIKANLGLVKVLVVKSEAGTLRAHLQGIVEELVALKNTAKKHFKAKTKVLVETLIKKCGLDAVKAVMPVEHMRLLTNIRKTMDRKERKAKSDGDADSIHSRTTVSRLSRQSKWNHSRVFSDFGDGDGDNSDSENEGSGYISQRSRTSFSRSKASSRRPARVRQAAKSLLEDQIEQAGEDDPLDLLDSLRTRSALHSTARLKRKKDTSDEPEIDPQGRLIVREDGDEDKDSPSSDGGSDIRSQAASSRAASADTRAVFRKRRRTDAGWAYAGGEYKSKKAGGDVKRKDKLEPYAYWPLDRKLLNRRSEHKAAARNGMARVMKFAKKFEGKSASAALPPASSRTRKKKNTKQKKKLGVKRN